MRMRDEKMFLVFFFFSIIIIDYWIVDTKGLSDTMRNETNNDEDIFENFETEVGIIPLDHNWQRYLDRSLFDNLSRFNTGLPVPITLSVTPFVLEKNYR